MNQYIFRALLPAIVGLLALSARSQSTGGSLCDSCYHGYHPDTSFVFGAIDLRYEVVDTGHDSLGLDLSLFYHGPTSVDSASTDSTVVRIRRTLERLAFHGMGMAYPPVLFHEWLKLFCIAVENYAGYASDTLQAFDLQHLSARGFPDLTLRSRHYVWGWSDTTTSGRSDYMAGKPRYTNSALGGAHASHYAMLDAIHPGRYPDSSRYFRITFTLAADSNLTATPADDAELVAWGVVLARDTARLDGGRECACANYLPIDTLPITRGMLRSAPRVGNGYADVSTRYYSLDELPSLSAGLPPASREERCHRECERLATRRGAIGEYAPWGSDVEGSEHLLYRFYSAGRFPLRLLRGTIRTHMFDLLERGDLDTLIHRVVDDLYDQPLMRRTYRGLGIADEPQLTSFRAYGLVVSRADQYMAGRGIAPLPSYSISYGNFDALRHFTGDLDTTRIRLVQGIVVDHYINGDTPAPITYANPDSMDRRVLSTWYRTTDSISNGKIFRPRMILGNNIPDYTRYLNDLQRAELGSVADIRSGATTVRGPLVPNLARAVDVARWKYPGNGPAPLVYNTVGSQGVLGVDYRNGTPVRYTGTFDIRPPTPEEITVQCWLALNCGVDGLLYGHINFDGISFGVMRLYDGARSTEYDTIAKPNDPTNAEFHIPRIWTGFRSRFDAIRRANEEIRRIVPVYQRLVHRGEQISVFDPRRSIGTIPILDTIVSEIPRRDLLVYTPTGRFDSRDETYMEVTLLHPPAGEEPGTRYLLLTNRRCWPIDHRRYGDGTRGLGNIDVRRPWITLRHDLPASRYTIEKVGHEAEWSRQITPGTPTPLDWLEPGWGTHYRLRPHPAPVAPTSPEDGGG